jgi:hypothetical protein
MSAHLGAAGDCPIEHSAKRLAVHDKYANGDEFVGEVRIEPPPPSAGPDSRPRIVKHGLGTYRFASGSQYDGEWANGRMHGWGIFVEHASGDRYEGYWEDGQRTMGLYAFGNGDVYQGCFDGSLKHGRGIAWEDRQMYEVVYNRDVLVSKKTFATQREPTFVGDGCRAPATAPPVSTHPRQPRTGPSRDRRAVPPEAQLLRRSDLGAGAVPRSRTITAAQYEAARAVLKVPRRATSARAGRGPITNTAVQDMPRHLTRPATERSAAGKGIRDAGKGLHFEREDILRAQYRYF